jgi:hypothetical protein
MDDEAMTEADVVALMGAERFHRLRAGGWLTPFYRLPGHEGRPRYVKHLVDFRHEEDVRLHPGGRRSAVVAKAYRGGVPDVVIDRDGMRHLVVPKAAPAAARGLTPRVLAEAEKLLEAVGRWLTCQGIRW